jgi:hypothetical protein
MKIEQSLFTKVKGVRFRKTPNSKDSDNIIRELKEAQKLIFVDGPWVKVQLGNDVGWVHADYLTEKGPVLAENASGERTHVFKIGVPNFEGDDLTKHVRAEIGDIFNGGKNKFELQCTEYVQYRVKEKLGVAIRWPVDSGRSGGKWAEIFEKNNAYKILETPEANCAMCFTSGISTNPIANDVGHIAFVEAVNPDGTIKISEANWPRNGIYNERTLTEKDWKEKYKARFVKFN